MLISSIDEMAEFILTSHATLLAHVDQILLMLLLISTSPEAANTDNIFHIYTAELTDTPDSLHDLPREMINFATITLPMLLSGK
jgi:hypothetical protein